MQQYVKAAFYSMRLSHASELVFVQHWGLQTQIDSVVIPPAAIRNQAFRFRDVFSMEAIRSAWP